MFYVYFEWDEEKEKLNIKKHRISFEKAARAFLDSKRVIIKDEKHSKTENRFFCLGKVSGNVLTVRFTKVG